MTRPRVYVDTNAHIPYYLSDLFGFLATYSVIDLLWSAYLVDEILEVVARVHGPDSVKPRVAQWAALRAAFPEGEVTSERWQSRIADASGVDDDDLPHQAAALAGGASVLVTSDRAGFPAGGLARHGVLVLTPDQCLVELLLDDPLRVAETLVSRCAMFRRAPQSLDEYLDVLARSVPRFARAAAEVCAHARDLGAD